MPSEDYQVISHKNKCIYVHIPKAAGTSIIEILQDPDDGIDEDFGETVPFAAADFKFDPPPNHLRAVDYLKYRYLSKEQYQSYFKFSFVRNPWARIVSEYKYRNYAWKYSFKEFIFNYFPQPSWSDRYCHVIPQYDFLYDEKGNKQVDFIGRFENIQNDFNEVCSHLNIPERKLVHSNQSQGFFHMRYDAGPCEILKRIRGKLSIRQRQNTFDHYTKYYDQETKDYVGKLYQKDIETFAYSFD